MLPKDTLELILHNEQPKVERVQYGDQTVSALVGPGHKIQPLLAPYKETVELMSLESFVHFVAEHDAGKFIVVNDNTEVIYAGEQPEGRSARTVLAKAHIDPVGVQELRNLNQEEFMIALRARFAPSEDRDYLLSVAAKVVASRGVEQEDNGVSQKVTIRQSAAFMADAVIKPVVVLRPFRTFYELDQPNVEMMLRIKQDKEGGDFRFSLLDCDGGRWAHDCMAAIAEYLRGKIKTYPVWF